jgi:signal peptide peptidase SppA
MINYPLIGQRLFNTPLMLRPEKCEVVVAALLDHFGVAKLNRIDGTSMGVVELRQQASEEMENGPRARRMFDIIDGVAIIPIQGSLAQRVGGIDPYSGMIGYNQIELKLEAAMSDDSVRAILLDVDSPGGEVAGCFDLSRKIASYSKRNGGKPIVGAANEQACSAGYAILSACDESFMPETGVVGSIGVWTLLVDMTRALDKDGVEVTMVRAGDRKARGGPYERADKATVDKLFAWVEATRVQFAELVAHNRGISVDQVMAQEGDWYHGDDAIHQRLIDGIGPFEAIFQRARTLANA